MTLSPFTATSDEHGCDSAAGTSAPPSQPSQPRSPFSSRRQPDAPRSRAVPPVLGMGLSRSGSRVAKLGLSERAEFGGAA